MKTKLPAVFELATCGSVEQSYSHCTSEIDTKFWRAKLFYNGSKTPCCDVLLKKVKMTVIEDIEAIGYHVTYGCI